MFRFDSPVMTFLAKVGDLILLNLMWIIGCLPVITVGASTTALYACITKFREDSETSLVRAFWQVFREEWKQATLLWLTELAVAAVLAADVYIVLFSGIGTVWLIPVLILPAVVAFLASGYLFPLQARFCNSVPQTLKNALMLAVYRLPTSVLIGAVNLLPVLLLLFLPDVLFLTGIFWVFVGGSLLAYVNSFLLQRVFRKFEPEESAE